MNIRFPLGVKLKPKKNPVAQTEARRLRFQIVAVVSSSLSSIFGCALLAVCVTMLLVPQIRTPHVTYKIGDIARQDIKAPQDFSVVDIETTEQRKQEKAEAVVSMYDFNSRADEDAEQRITKAFSMMREAIQKAVPHGALEERERLKFQEILKAEVSEHDFSVLAQSGFAEDLKDALLDLTLPFLQREIVHSKDQLFRERKRGIMLRDLYTQQEIFVADFSTFVDMKEIDMLVQREARRILRNYPQTVRETLIALALKLIEPTVTYNPIETNARRAAAMQDVTPLYYTVQKGEIIVREGTKINEAALIKLQALEKFSGKKNIIGILAGYFLLMFLSLYILYLFVITNISGTSIAKISRRDFLFLVVMLIVSCLMTKLCVLIGDAFQQEYVAIPPDAYLYIIPFATTAMVISIVLSPPIASLSAIVIALFSCLLLDGRFSFFVYSFISSLIAAQEVRFTKERKTVIRAGFRVGMVNSLLIISLCLATGDMPPLDIMIAVGFGFLGGMVAAVFATGIIPIIEIVFNYTTDIKLLELADLNQPLLRNLLIAAPGTYHHSILVGILAEAAAEAIHANPLLARVSAYYHDIGKMKKPLYFVENQKNGENKHDRLLPSMSSLIIISHVKDGIDLARQYRLGRPIQDIIAQHHGTSCITYFYQKARELQQDEEQTVTDQDFRYPGPKPQTKEAGIVMLADAVQATSKTLTDPSPSRIQGMVQRIINNIFVDGQLDECELTLNDLHLIGESFNRILNGIFHSRIEYPDISDRDGNGKDLGKKPTKADSDRSRNDTTDGERDFERLGVTKSRAEHPAAR
ncbi:MAG: HDIG domain-containing protein [Desulfobacterota bacterium]|nr:HDIG domain-containing protein [Thermodesulfobacteriota bacterium]